MRHAMRATWPTLFWQCGIVAAAIVTCWTASPTARATDIEEYNFNTSPSGWTSGPGEWTWTEQGSNEKSWKVLLSGTNPAANYLYSPCLTVTDTSVRFDFQEHRFKVGTSGTVAPITYVPPAGQVQYTLDGITWQGVPLALWSNTGPDVPPTLNPADLLPTTTALLTSGYAFQGMSAGYDQPNPAFIKSGFDLTLALGSSLQFRLLGDLGGQSFAADPLNPLWDVDNVQIKGVLPGPCVPEPGAVALAAIGGAALAVLRFRRRTRKRGGAVAMTAAAVMLFASAPASTSEARADVLYDFQLNNGGWTKSEQGFVPSQNEWTYYSTGDRRWGVRSMGVDGGTSSITAAHLTSGTISGIVEGTPSQLARISLAHSFLLPPSGTGGPRPITLGQLSYRLNGSGSWLGVPQAAFANGGSVNTDDPVFGPSVFKNPIDPSDPFFVDQTAYVAPAYVTPAVAPLLPYVAPGGASFVGQSNGWSTLYVPSQALLSVPTGITTIQLRLTNANLGGNCDNNEGWNVRMVAIEFAPPDLPPVPEPGTLALALAGGGVVCVARRIRRRPSPAALEAE